MKASGFLLIALLIASPAFCQVYVDAQAKAGIAIGDEGQREQPKAAPKHLESRVGWDVVITLASNRTTGYRWQLAEPVDKNILKLATVKYTPDQTGRVGSGGKEVWIFKAIGAGETVVSFKYVRPWEKNTPPANTQALTVRVREKK